MFRVSAHPAPRVQPYKPHAVRTLNGVLIRNLPHGPVVADLGADGAVEVENLAAAVELLQDAAEVARVVAGEELATSAAAGLAAQGDAVLVGHRRLEAQRDFGVHAPLHQGHDRWGGGVASRMGAQDVDGAVKDERVAAVAKTKGVFGLAKRKFGRLARVEGIHRGVHHLLKHKVKVVAIDGAAQTGGVGT